MPRHAWHHGRARGFDVASRLLAPSGEDGSGCDVVLVHGLGVSSAYMVPLLEQVGRTSRCWAPDLPGHGRSKYRGAPLRLRELVDVLGHWLTSVGVHRPVLVANSFGSQVVVELVRAGVPVAGLLLVGPTTDLRRASFVQHISRLLADQPFEPPPLIPMQAAEYVRTGTWRTVREFLDGRSHDMLTALDETDVPLILARGTRDPIVTADWLAALSAVRPDAKVVEVPGRGHCIHYSEPRLVAGLVGELVAGRDLLVR